MFVVKDDILKKLSEAKLQLKAMQAQPKILNYM